MQGVARMKNDKEHRRTAFQRKLSEDPQRILGDNYGKSFQLLHLCSVLKGTKMKSKRCLSKRDCRRHFDQLSIPSIVQNSLKHFSRILFNIVSRSTLEYSRRDTMPIKIYHNTRTM